VDNGLKTPPSEDDVNEFALAHDVAPQKGVSAGEYYFSENKRFRFIEKSLHERGFAAFFKQNVQPEVLKLEKQRLHRVKWLCIRVAGLLLLGFLGKSFILQIGNLEQYSGEYTLLMPILAVLIGAHPERTYKADYKKTILPKILKFFKTLSYNVNGKIDTDLLRDSDILPPHTSYNSEDMVHGEYNGSRVALTEVRLFDAHNKKKSTNNFKGLFILIETEHDFKGKTIIRKDMGIRKKWTTGKIAEKQEIPLIEERFSKRFKVYTTDIDEANRIVSPTLLETFMNLSGRFKNTTMEGCFYGNKVFITIPCDANLFEPASIFMPAYDINDLRLLIEEVSLVFKLIDTIKNIKNIT
jgi:hypothetical protein